MKKVITNKYGPNTTILLPGSCNIKCSIDKNLNFSGKGYSDGCSGH